MSFMVSQPLFASAAGEPILLMPGPVPIPAFIHAAIAQPVIPHRTAAFRTFYRQLLDDLRYFFQAENAHVCTMTGSGTYGMAVAIRSLFSDNDQIVVVTNGKFSERWAGYARSCGMSVAEVAKPWGEVPTAAEIAAAVAATPNVKGVIITHCETSTGALADLEEIAFAVRRVAPDVVLLVDAMTTVGAIPFYFDAWGIDCAITAQKTLMCPSGVVEFALSDRAFARLQPTHEGDFTNLFIYAIKAETANYPFTAPVNLLYGVAAGAAYLRKQSLPVIWNEVHAAAAQFRATCQQRGYTHFPQQFSDSLSVVFPPANVSADTLRGTWEAEHGIIVSGGQEEIAGRVLRVAHFGVAAHNMARLCAVM